MGIRKIAAFLSLIFIYSMCNAKSKPLDLQEAKESGAAVFFHLMQRGTEGGGWYESGDKVYLQAFFKDKDVTSASTIRYYRSKGIHAQAGWLSEKYYPKGGYALLQLSNPLKTEDGEVKWEVQQWNVVQRPSTYDNSLAQMWVWVKKTNGKWYATKRKGGVTAG